MEFSEYLESGEKVNIFSSVKGLVQFQHHVAVTTDIWNIRMESKYYKYWASKKGDDPPRQIAQTILLYLLYLHSTSLYLHSTPASLERVFVYIRDWKDEDQVSWLPWSLGYTCGLDK